MVTKDEEDGNEEIIEETQAEKKKKTKKVVRKRKSKKEREHPLTNAVRLTVETGKVAFGSKKGLKNIEAGKAKVFVVAGNIRSETREMITQYSKASEVPILEYEGSSVELGSICGKPYPVSVLSVFDVGNSNLLKLVKKKKT